MFHLFQKLVSKFSDEWVPVVSVGMNKINERAALCVVGTLDAHTHHAHAKTPFCYPDVEAFESEASLLCYRIGVGARS